jgi:hypothetical protein
MTATMRRPLTAAAIAVACAAAAALLPAARADAATTRHCRSADLRYPFTEGGPKTFGVFRLRITNGRCRRAHRVAKDWMTEFEANIAAGHVKLPHMIDGFHFTTLPATEAQTYRERGRRGATTLWFDYRIPNG